MSPYRNLKIALWAIRIHTAFVCHLFSIECRRSGAMIYDVLPFYKLLFFITFSDVRPSECVHRISMHAKDFWFIIKEFWIRYPIQYEVNRSWANSIVLRLRLNWFFMCGSWIRNTEWRTSNFVLFVLNNLQYTVCIYFHYYNILLYRSNYNANKLIKFSNSDMQR